MLEQPTTPIASPFANDLLPTMEGFPIDWRRHYTQTR